MTNRVADPSSFDLSADLLIQEQKQAKESCLTKYAFRVTGAVINGKH